MKMGIGQLLKRILPPSYAFGPLVAAVSLNMVTYFGVRLINADRTHYMIQTPLDARIPLVSAFVVIYFLAFGQWVLGYLLCCHESREVCLRVITGDLIAKALTMIIFLIYPTTMLRPQVTGSGLFDRAVAWLFSIDAPDNLFPSIHCLESWICLRSSFYLKKVPAWYRPFSVVFSLLVFASTVLLRQHQLPDIPAGIMAAELGLWISGRWFPLTDSKKDTEYSRYGISIENRNGD